MDQITTAVRASRLQIANTRKVRPSISSSRPSTFFGRPAVWPSIADNEQLANASAAPITGCRFEPKENQWRTN